MSKLVIEYAPGATPLDPNEKNGLIPDYITTQGELNSLERENIIAATAWALGKKHDPLDISFCMNLHKRMLKDVWKWAGQPRLTDKNIGVPKEQIQTKLKLLMDDAKFWIANKTYDSDEIAFRFHHRLVSIHPFANGNGRHARLMTDILLESLGAPVFTWGKADLVDPKSTTRSEYLAALKDADNGKYNKLQKFVRS